MFVLSHGIPSTHEKNRPKGRFTNDTPFKALRAHPERRSDARNRLPRIHAAVISHRAAQGDGRRNASSATSPTFRRQNLGLHKRRISRSVGALAFFRSTSEKLFVVVGLLKRLDKRIHGSLNVVAIGEHTTHCPNERRLLRIKQQIFSTGARCNRIDCRKMRCYRQRASSFTSMLPVPLNLRR